jgi:hypothetical protein
MSEIRHIPPQVPDIKALNGREYSYRAETKGVLGNVIESQKIVVVGKSISVSQWKQDKAGVVDYLAIIGGVAIAFFGMWLVVQGVKGVLKSENTNGYGIERVADGFGGVDRLVG